MVYKVDSNGVLTQLTEAETFPLLRLRKGAQEEQRLYLQALKPGKKTKGRKKKHFAQCVDKLVSTDLRVSVGSCLVQQV